MRHSYLPTHRNFSPVADLREKDRDRTPLRDACDCFANLALAIALPILAVTLLGMWVNSHEKQHYREDGSLVLPYPYRNLTKEWEVWVANPPDWVKCRDSACLNTEFMLEISGLGIPTYYNESTRTIHYLHHEAQRTIPVDLKATSTAPRLS